MKKKGCKEKRERKEERKSRLYQSLFSVADVKTYFYKQDNVLKGFQ